MRVLGVDPGSQVTGWGLVEGHPSQPKLVDCGVIRPGATRPFPERLYRLQTSFHNLVERLAPEAAAVEAPFHRRYARAALQLAHARGVILAVLVGAGLEVAEYTPAAVKKSVTGNGRAEKDQVRAMVGRLLAASGRDWGTDLADALAVALCHLSSAGFQEAVARVGRR